MAKVKTPKRELTEDLFATLSASAETVQQKRGSKKQERPQIQLTQNEEKAFELFCASDVLHKIAKGKQEAAKSLILPILRKKLLEKWSEDGHKTENPVIQTDKARANFIVREILKVELPEEDSNVKDRLVEIGFSEEEAANIFAQEFTEKLELDFRSLNELRDGNQNERDVINKLLQMVIENFSEEEKKLLLRKQMKVDVNSGFLDRAVQHCEGSVEKLDALLSFVSPQWVLSHMTFKEGLENALSQVTKEVVPEPVKEVKSEEFYSNDQKWKAMAKGNEATLYMVMDDNEQLLGTKKCDGPEHARMTCVKWMRDQAYRGKSVTAFLEKK